MSRSRPASRFVSTALVPALVLGLSVTATTVHADPVCAEPATRGLCGGRVFPEPSASATALTYDQTVLGLAALRDEFPEWVTFETFGEGSFNGNDLLLVEITDPDSPIPLADRKIVLVNQSIHGNEPGGREGGPRYLEDLLRGGDPERVALLDRVRLVQTFINPDGWVAGDPDPDALAGDSAGLWKRGNGNGVGAADFGGTDLNRQSPYRGLIPTGRDPVSEPESRSFEALVRGWVDSGQDIQVSTDVHGEVTVAAANILLSSGQFDLKQAMTALGHGVAMAEDVTEAVGDDPLLEPGGALFGTVPALLQASSEFAGGGSGSGFQGDWLAQREGGDSASLSTVELISLDALPAGGPGLNAVTARREVLQLYRDTVAALMGSMIDQAVVEYEPTVTGTGPVAYVADMPPVADPVRTGVVVSSEDFYTELGPYVADGLTAIAPGDLDAAALADVDDLVVSTANLLADLPALAAIRAFVQGGGNVVLTDDAAQLLPLLTTSLAADALTPADVTPRLDDIGRVDLVGQDADDDGDLHDGVRDGAFLLSELATTGRVVTGGSANVPTWRVTRARWEAAGGTTDATSGGATSIGTLPLGLGTIRVIGVLVPEPQPQDVPGVGRNLYGINGHGVVDGGYQVFVNALDGTLEVAEVPSIVRPGPTLVTVSVDDVVVDEDAGEAVLTIALDVAAGREVTLRAATADDTATAGQDYTAVAQDVVVAAEATRAELRVPIIDDGERESRERFTVTLTTTDDDVRLPAAPAEVAIVDDEVDQVVVTVADVTVRETAGDAALVLQLDDPAPRGFTVRATTADDTATAGQDYAAVDRDVAFARGETEQTVTVAIRDDREREPRERFVLELATSDPGVQLPDEAPAVLVEDDEVVVTVADVTVTEGTDAEAVLVLRLDAPADRALTIEVATEDDSATAGEDYTATTAAVTFAVGEREQDVSVPLRDDVVPEPQERFTLALSATDTGVLLPVVAPAVSVIDDDSADSASPPEAAIGPLPSSLFEGRPVTFDGTGSSDPDGDIATYTWTFGDGATANGARVSHTYVDDADYPVTLTVTDTGGRSDVATRDVAIANVAPTIAVGDDRTAAVGETLTLTATVDDVPADTVRVVWDFGVGSSTAEGRTVTHTWATAGARTVRATATDDDGAARSDTLTVTVTEAPARVTRSAGTDRIATAVQAAVDAFPDGAAEVLLARSDAFPDALAGSRLAAELGAPLLLTRSDVLPASVRDELARLAPDRITVLGGPAAVSDDVVADLRATYGVRRVAGDDRFETAALIAEEVGPTGDRAVVLALGAIAAPAAAWPDALSASSLAVAPDGLPVLLTRQDRIPAVTLTALEDLGTERTVIAGGTSAVGTAVEAELAVRGLGPDRVAGDTRYGTSALLAEAALARWGTASVDVVVATGADFPDGLAAGAVAARRGAVVLLVHPVDLDGSPQVRQFLRDHADRLDDGLVVGGTTAVSTAVEDELRSLLGAS